MIVTLSDVYAALNEGNYNVAAKQLQELLRRDPSADAWYLAAELTLDHNRDQAIRHLKRALLIDPRHGDSLTLLGQLGESREITVADVAEEVADAVVTQTSHTPVLRHLSRTQQLIAAGGLSVLLIAALVVVYGVLFPRSTPLSIPEEAPAAQELKLLDYNRVFTQFTSSDLQLFAIEPISSASGRRTLKFSVPGADGLLRPVQVIVYDSISDMVRDRAHHRQLETTARIVASTNALLVYDKSLQGLVIEGQLVRHFQFITGTS